MDQLLNPENAFFSVVRKIVDLVWLSVLWAVCSVFVVTAGAATSGLYYAVVKNIRRGRSYPSREFFYGMKENFWKATAVWMVILMFLVMMLVGDVPLFAAFFKLETAGDAAFSALFFLKLLIPALVFLYAFPMMSRFEMSVVAILEKSLILSLRHIVRTVPLVLLLFVTIVLAAAEPLFLLFFLPGLYCLAASYLLEPVWKRYTKALNDGEEPETDAWYME